MKQTSFFTAWVQRSSMLLATLLIFSGSVFAQSTGANFMSVFGNASGCGNNTNRMSCAITPSTGSGAFTGVTDPDDVFATFNPGAYPDFFKNSVYDKAGDLLFSTNSDGIYAPDGTQLFLFDGDLSYDVSSSCGYPATQVVPLGPAISEICIVPVPGKCNSYYAICWCGFIDYEGLYRPNRYNVLRCVEVDIDPTTYPSESAYSFVDNTMGMQPDCSSFMHNFFQYNAGSMEVVADAPNTDGSRDIYTVNFDPDNYTNILKWHIDATGNLPTSFTTISAGALTLGPITTKAKIFQVAGGDKDLVYVAGGCGTASTGWGTYLQFYDLTHTYIGAERLPSSVTDVERPIIWGFEYLPNLNTYCVSYDEEYYSGLTGGLAYFTPGSGMIAVPSTTNYAYSDMELNKDGDLIMVYNDGSGNNSLAYVNKSYLTTSSSITTALTSEVVPGNCGANISVNNYQAYTTLGSPNYAPCLGSQVRGDTYNWGTADITAGNYEVSGAEIWTPASNPIQAATGVATSSISANNITIAPGASLTIQSMTVTMTPNSVISVEAGTPIGGRLVLDAATLTHNTTGCNTGNMWQGVRVFGSPGNSQIIPPTSLQGMLTMENGSTIAYAQVGAAAGGSIISSLYGISLLGGGIIQASNSTFYNNNTGALFSPYANMFGGTERPNASYFNNCAFNSDDISTVTGTGGTGTLMGITGSRVKGVTISGCTFTNGIGNSVPTYGIYGTDMGFNAGGYRISVGGYTPSTFSNYYMGIADYCTGGSYTPAIGRCVFNNNIIGANLNGCIAPQVTLCTFNIPSITYTSYPTYYYYSIGYWNTIGLFLQGADLYSVFSNTFTGSSPNTTVGVLAWNTGADENQINNNTYTNLSEANLSNFINGSGPGTSVKGLWYKCNANSDNVYDISVLGDDKSTDGIRNTQGIPAGGWYPVGSPTPTYYLHGLPAGNTFSTGGSAINLYVPTGPPLPPDVYTIYYNYNSSVGADPMELPGIYGTTGLDMGGITITPIAQPDGCALPTLSITGVGSVSGSVSSVSCVCPMPPYPVPMPIQPSPGTVGVEAYLDNLMNINYYMCDSNGIQHRDSLYYWVGQLHSASGDLATAHLLLEDGYADSAYALYHSIPAMDSLTGIDSAEFAGPGSKLFDVQSNVAGYYANINSAMAYANSHELNADSVYNADSSLWNHPVLDSADEDSLAGVFNSSQFWARNRAENILFAYAPDTIKAMLTVMPDTLMFPVIDSTGDSTGRKAHSGTGNGDNNGTQPSLNNLGNVQNTIYPNPVTNTLLVIYQPVSDNRITLELDDISGRKMITQPLQSGSNTIDVSALPPGMYLYKVYEGVTLTMKGKVVKQ